MEVLKPPGVELNGFIAHFFLPIAQIKAGRKIIPLDTALTVRGPSGMVGAQGKTLLLVR